MIDYKGGKVVWDSSREWSQDHDYYCEDILQIIYGENCVIDVGSYGSQDWAHYTIMVIDYRGSYEDDKSDAWSNPYAFIPCKDKEDMLVQLQRAIDIYPAMIP